jgi:hypothetical protein
VNWIIDITRVNWTGFRIYLIGLYENYWEIRGRFLCEEQGAVEQDRAEL